MEGISNSSENVEVADETDTRPTESPQVEHTSPSHIRRGSIVATPAASAALMEEYYSTSNPKRGLALIINQVKFRRMTQRDGSNRDRDSISSVLSEIGFDVRVYDDPNKKKLLAMLEEIANEDHSQNDCLVVVVMTHGDKDVLHASDDSYPVGRLWEPFVGNGCKTLVGKPKLFFIQACRGETFDVGVKMSKVLTDTVDARSSSEQLLYVIPTMADLLVMYSTYDGHYSWRNPINGSWFIQSLSMELEKNAHSKELLHLLTGVSRRVAYQYQSNVPGNSKMDAKKQMPCIVSMLTKLFYFPRK
ncbi:caspase-1-like [Anopheles marshallii]|uniref:caspase-1-like n=1 Tax=Anopheles marshallii TaxID=1521116 RepID=UPI00237B6FCD|nr:caspase-1-like [Anopheles marshallii]